MTRTAGVTASLALVTFPCLATAQTVRPVGTLTAAPGAVAGQPQARPARNAAIALLSKRVESVDWVETPFEEVVDWLKDNGDGQVNVIPRWTALGVENVDRDSFVTLQLKNVTVGEVLVEVLEQLVDDNELAFRATGNLLKISTKSDFGRRLELRVYNVTDILHRVPDMGQSSPSIDLTQTGTTGGGSGGGGGGGQTVFGTGGGGGSSQGGGEDRGGQQAERRLETRLQTLATTIQAAIAPETWASNGQGGRGTIATHNLLLIVVNTVEVHEQIAGYFAIGE